MANWGELAENGLKTLGEAGNWLKDKINPLLTWLGEQLSKLQETAGNFLNQGTKAAKETAKKASTEVQKTVAAAPEMAGKLGNSAQKETAKIGQHITTIAQELPAKAEELVKGISR